MFYPYRCDKNVSIKLEQSQACLVSVKCEKHLSKTNLCKLARIMKLTAIMILAALMQVSASAYSQTKLNLKINNTSIESVLKEIENQSEFFFLYNNKQIDVTQKINIDVTNKSIDDVLGTMLKETGICYLMKDRQIVLYNGDLNSITNSIGGVQVGQQQKSVSGKVTDHNRQPLPGVTVVIKGTSQGTVTDANGEYALSRISPDMILQFSFVGMKTEELEVGNQSRIDVALKEETVGIEEVVAVGYGVQSQKKLTTSVARFKSEQMEGMPLTNIADAFSGQISGVLSENGVGTPGASPVIRIRGYGSINAGSEPLYVIDGMMASSTQFASLNPKSVESIDILKDAAAGAIYGSRAGNGVILVTTKKGKQGEAKFSFSATYGLQEVSKKVDVLDRDQWLSMVKEAYNNDGKELPDFYDRDASNFANTNWQDEIFRTSPYQNYQISATGSSGKIQYYLSANILDNEGIVLTTYSRNYSSNGNFDIELNPKLKVGLTYNASHNKERVNASMSGFGHGSGGYGISGGIIQQALWFAPIIPVYTESGDYGQYMQGEFASYFTKGYANPVCNLLETHDTYSKNNVMGRTYLDYEMVKGLSLNTSFSGALYSYFRDWYVSPYLAGNGSPYANFSNPIYENIKSGQTNGMSNSWTAEAYLNYKHTFADIHHFDIIAGYSRQYSGSHTTSASSSANDRGTSNALDPIDAYDNYYQPNIYGAALVLGSGSFDENAFESLFSRINYSYKDKYMFMASIRRDGSSKFAPEERWGFFPALSGAWRISQESFMKGVKWVDELKLRTSYGVSGNDQFGNYAWQGTVNYNNLYTYGSTDTGSSGTGKVLIPSTIENNHLKWETNEQINIGTDVSIFNSRINLTADYFIRKTKDMLLYRSLPLENGISSSLFDNIGNMTNKGIELSLKTINIKSGNFSWTTDMTFTKIRNKVKDVFTSTGEIQYAAGTTASGFGSAIRIIEGHPMFEIYSYKVLGNFETQEQLDSYPRANNALIGDVMIEDYSKDGQINTDDLQPMGHVLPDFTYGLTTTLKYKNFDLSIVIDGSEGASKVVSCLRQAALMRTAENTLQSYYDDRYREGETGHHMAYASTGVTGARHWNMSYFIYDASFTRIKNVILGYNLPESLCSRLKISDARLTMGVQNLHTFSDYPLLKFRT